VRYTSVSAGGLYTVFLRSDDAAVACGGNAQGQCNPPSLEKGVTYTSVSAGAFHTVLLRSDGAAVACGDNGHGQCNLPSVENGLFYRSGESTTVPLQIELEAEDNDIVTIVCTNVGGDVIGRITGLSAKDALSTLLTNIGEHLQPLAGSRWLFIVAGRHIDDFNLEATLEQVFGLEPLKESLAHTESEIAVWFAECVGLEVGVAETYAAQLSANGITTLQELVAKPMAQWGLQVKPYDAAKVLKVVREGKGSSGT